MSVLKMGHPPVLPASGTNGNLRRGRSWNRAVFFTTSSKKLIESLHEMPVILHPQEFSLWLDRTTTDPEHCRSYGNVAGLADCQLHAQRFSRLYQAGCFVKAAFSIDTNLCHATSAISSVEAGLFSSISRRRPSHLRRASFFSLS